MSEGPPLDPRLEGWSEQLYRSLVERVPAIVYVDSNDQRPDTLYISPQVEDLLGTPPEVYLRDPTQWYRQVHPNDVDRIAAAWRLAREHGRVFECEYRMLHADGSLVWIRDSAVPLRDASGEIVCWQGVLIDDTAGKLLEQELRAAQDKYRALVENLPAIVYLVAPDDDRRTLYVSPHVERALGYTREEWLEQPDIWMELLHPDDREPTLAAHDRHNVTGEPWSREYRLIASDGRPVWIRDVATLVRDERGQPSHWQGLQLDITALKEAEEELRRAHRDLELRVRERTAELEEANALMALEIAERRLAEARLAEAEERYRLLVEQIPAVTYTWARVGEAWVDEYTSPRIEQLLGYTPQEWSADPDLWISRIHPDDRQRILAADIRSEATGEPFDEEYRYLHRDGHIVWVRDTAVLVDRDEAGRPLRFQGITVDISARKEAEAKAERTELRYRNIAEQVPGIIYVLERRDGGRFTLAYVSPQIREILGIDPDTRPPLREWLELVHPQDRARVDSLIARVERSGEPWVVELRLLHADGHVVWVRDRGRVLERDAAGRPSLVQGLAVVITKEMLASEDAREAAGRTA